MKKLIFVLFSVIGLGLLVGGVTSFFSSQKFLETALSTEGEVTELIRHTSSDNSVTYSPEVRFETSEGEEVIFQSSYSTSPPSHSKGEKVKVWYDPTTPQKARLDGFGASYMGSVILGILGLLSTAFGTGPLAYFARRKRLTEELKAHGQKIVGSVTSIEIDGSFSVNGKNPYRIFATAPQALGGSQALFKSEFIWFDPTQLVQKGQAIDIYIDPQKSSRYYVDTSFLPSIK